MKFKIKREVQIGILVVVSATILVWGLNYLKGINVFKKERTYCAIYDRIEGLAVSNPVQVHGYTVGRVREISLLPDRTGRLFVKFSVTDPNLELPLYTTAKISSLDLLGSKSVTLILGLSTDEFHEVGDTLNSSVEASLTEEVNNQILPLKKKAEDLLLSIDTTIRVIQAILDKDARDNLSASFESIKNALSTFERVALRLDTMVYTEKAKISSIMTNFNSISNNLRNNNENITQILDNLTFITDSIALSNLTATINNAGQAFSDAATILEKIERGEGSLGQLVNNDSLYNYLETSARDLDLLLLDIQDHPNRYVHFSLFGGKDKETKRREKEQRKLEKQKKKMNNEQ